jgi:hypothetical protein
MANVFPLIAVCVAVLSACHPGPGALPAAQCPTWENVDLGSLPTHLNNDPGDPLLEDIWAAWAAERSNIAWRTTSPASTVHFVTSPGGLSSDATEREVTGRRSAEGWEIYARSRTVPLPPEPWSDWRAVRLSPQASQRLDAILGNPCLWSGPRFLDDEVRLLNGRYDSRPDGPSTSYDVAQGHRRWGGLHFSWSLGPPGQLRSLLLSEAFGLPEWVDEDIGPDGWFDQSS